MKTLAIDWHRITDEVVFWYECYRMRSSENVNPEPENEKWQHARDKLVQPIVKRVNAGVWPNSDYETIYVFHIAKTGQNGIPQATLEIQQEDLTNSLSDTCLGPK